MAGQLSLPGLDEAPAVGALSHRLRTDRRTDTTDDLPGEAYCRQHSALPLHRVRVLLLHSASR